MKYTRLLQKGNTIGICDPSRGTPKFYVPSDEEIF